MIAFLSPVGGGLTFKRGIFGNLGKLETMMSACFGRSEDLVFSGATNGDIYIWRDTTLIKTIKAHDGPVFSMCSLDKVTSSHSATVLTVSPELKFPEQTEPQLYQRC